MLNQTMVYSCSAPEQEYTMVWFGIFLYLLISSLKIRFCEQSVFAKSPLKRFPKTQTLCTSVAEKALRSAICFFRCSSSESPMKISASMPQNTSSLGNCGQALIDPPKQKGLKRGDMYLRNFPIERPFESTLRNNSWSTAPTRNTLFH